MEEGARTATTEDVARLAELATEAVAELTGAKGGPMWSRREARRTPVADSIAAAVADADHEVVAGTIDGTVMGYGVVRTEALPDGAVLAVVDDLYVEPGARGVGVGEAVMDRLLAWAEERGAVGVDSLALPGTRDTKNFFERFGLVARAIVVHRPLPGSGSTP